MSGKKVHHKKQPNQNATEAQNEDNSSKEALAELAKQFNKQEGQPSDIAAEANETHAEQHERVAELEQEVKGLTDRILRLNAEMENLRRRHQKERAEAQSNGIKSFATDMSNVLDNLYRALESIDVDTLDENAVLKNIHTGVDMTRKSMESAFERFKIKRINPMGEKFDHNLHQAVSQVEEPEKGSGVVIQVIQPGYTIEEKLLRPALVVVSK